MPNVTSDLREGEHMQRLGTRRVRALLIVVVVLLLSASAAFALSARVEPVKSLAVYDANGRLVGEVFDAELPNPVVVINVDGIPVALTVSKSALGPAGNTSLGSLYFESADCTGPAFTDTRGTDELFQPVVQQDTRLYSLAESEQATNIRSFLHSDGVCELFAFDGAMTPVAQLVDLATQFQPPFELRVK